MRVRKLPFRQQLFIDFLACFLVGIVFANFMGADSFQKNGSLTRYYLKQFQYAEIQPQELLWHVGSERLTLFLVLLILGTILKGRLIHGLFVAWSGFAYGYFCVISISAFGMKGLLLCILALFPQFCAYVPMYLGLVELSGQRRAHSSWRWMTTIIFLLLMLIAGILLESYINPLILQKILKIF